jgi:SAM-dependent methyltransferase
VDGDGEPRGRADRALVTDALPGNSAKIRLLLDLIERRPARVLDVGCGDLALWTAVAELPGRVLGVDRSLPPALVEGIERRELDARELPFRGEFDAVVSTQMLDDVSERDAVLRGMYEALVPGGTLFLTCDSGDVPRPWRARLRGVPPAPLLEELGALADETGFAVQALRRYGRRDLKAVQAQLSGAERLRTLEQEEASEPGDPHEWGLLYLRATRPGARSRPVEPGRRD